MAEPRRHLRQVTEVWDDGVLTQPDRSPSPMNLAQDLLGLLQIAHPEPTKPERVIRVQRDRRCLHLLRYGIRLVYVSKAGSLLSARRLNSCADPNSEAGK
jgi:hypothetical protein